MTEGDSESFWMILRVLDVRFQKIMVKVAAFIVVAEKSVIVVLTGSSLPSGQVYYMCPLSFRCVGAVSWHFEHLKHPL